MSEFRRPIQESYGPSTVRIEKLDMEQSFSTVNVNGTNVILPMLNLKKYNSDAECYAFIERLYGQPMIMVDVLYIYKDISDRFENDEIFRNDFLNKFNRKYINTSNLMSPALTMSSQEIDVARPFADALKSSLQEAIGSQIFGLRKESKKNMEIETPTSSKKTKKDGIVFEFIKDFYEVISGSKVKKSTASKKQTVTYSMIKEAFFMKSGALIIDSEEISKFFTTFQTQINLGDDQQVKNALAIYISGLDSFLLRTSSDYRNKFGRVLLDSNLLEALSYFNLSKFPRLAYGGQYNEAKSKMDVNKHFEKYFDLINEMLVPTRSADDGR